MPGIDAHQHFWRYHPVRNSWITDDMGNIRKDFLPEDLYPLLQKAGFNGCVAVQADQSEVETNFLLELANQNDFIKGIVGWIDLKAVNAEEKLAHYAGFEKLVGFRHILQSEKQRDFMLRDDFLKGISLLHKYDFTYDILIYPDQLQYLPKLVSLFPQQRFVLNHIAKPAIELNAIEKWAEEIYAVSRFSNLYCKVSGMVTEADWNNWKGENFIPYINYVVHCFGHERVMFGSDWPVCLVAATYAQTLKIVADYFSQFDIEKQEQFFGGNATGFYKLK